MPNASISLARRRSAQLAAQSIKAKPEAVVISPEVLKARNHFAFFCEMMGKKPAKHMKEWHDQILTGESNDHLLDIHTKFIPRFEYVSSNFSKIFNTLPFLEILDILVRNLMHHP